MTFEPTPDQARFWAYTKRMPNGCIEWLGGRSHGYGCFCWNDGKSKRAHRAAMILTGLYDGPLVLDHVCRNKMCVNPFHLDPVTQTVNISRGIRRNKTHCSRGHEFTKENTGWKRGRHRVCLACHRMWNSTWRQKRKEGKP